MSSRQAQRNPARARNAISVNEVGDNSAPHASEQPGSEARENIFLFWPSIIGYCRIVLAIASLYYMPLHPRTCCVLYTISCLLDALDGYAARVFQQSTRFGAVLDMITDRCTTSCLLVFLSLAFPRWAIVFQGLIALDFSSHYMHMYTTLIVGGADTSHKDIDKTQSWLLNLYYSNKIVLFVFCALNELFFIALYLLSFSSPLSPQLMLSVEEMSGTFAQPGAPVNPSLLKQIFPDPFSAAALETARANKLDPFWPQVLVRVSFPVMAVKQFINVVQLVKASKLLADADVILQKPSASLVQEESDLTAPATSKYMTNAMSKLRIVEVAREVRFTGRHGDAPLGDEAMT